MNARVPSHSRRTAALASNLLVCNLRGLTSPNNLEGTKDTWYFTVPFNSKILFSLFSSFFLFLFFRLQEFYEYQVSLKTLKREEEEKPSINTYVDTQLIWFILLPEPKLLPGCIPSQTRQVLMYRPLGLILSFRANIIEGHALM